MDESTVVVADEFDKMGSSAGADFLAISGVALVVSRGVSVSSLSPLSVMSWSSSSFSSFSSFVFFFFSPSLSSSLS